MDERNEAVSVHNKARNQALGVIIGQLVDFWGKCRIQGFMKGLALPERSNLFHHNLSVFGRNGGRGSGAVGNSLTAISRNHRPTQG